MNGLSKGCPAAMCPHLSAVAQQVQALWEGDALRVGEYVVLCEGLVAAAAAGGDATLQSQVPAQRHWCTATSASRRRGVSNRKAPARGSYSAWVPEFGRQLLSNAGAAVDAAVGAGCVGAA